MHSISFTRKMLTSAAVLAALSVATVGMAGQAGASTTTPASSGRVHRLCANAQARQVHGRKLVASLSKRVSRAQALEAKAPPVHHS
jgi:hypothetical protein